MIRRGVVSRAKVDKGGTGWEIYRVGGRVYYSSAFVSEANTIAKWVVGGRVYYSSAFVSAANTILDLGKYLAITGIASSVLVFIIGVNMLFMPGIEVSDEMLDSSLIGVTIFTAVFMWIIAGLGFALSFLLFRGCNKILFSFYNNI